MLMIIYAEIFCRILRLNVSQYLLSFHQQPKSETQKYCILQYDKGLIPVDVTQDDGLSIYLPLMGKDKCCLDCFHLCAMQVITRNQVLPTAHRDMRTSDAINYRTGP